MPAAAGRGLRPVVLATGLSAFGPLPAFLLGGLAVLVREELRFSEARLGLSVAVFFALASLSASPAGRLSERLGARSALRLGVVASLVALVLACLARDWWQLTGALGIAGVGHAILQLSANLLLADQVAPAHQGLAFGIKQSAMPLATLVSGAAVPLLGTQLGWRWVYGVAAVLAAVVLVAQNRLQPSARRGAELARPLRPRPDAPFDRRQLLTLAVGVGLAGGAANAMTAFLVEFAVTSGLQVGLGGTLLAVASATGLVVRIVVGWLADIRGPVGLGSVAALLLAGSASLALLPVAGTGSALLWVAAIVAFAGGWGWPGLFTLVVAQRNAHSPAVATGTTQAGIFAGAVAGPLLFGIAVSHASYAVAWSGAAVAQLCAAIMVLAARRSWRGATASPPPSCS